MINWVLEKKKIFWENGKIVCFSRNNLKVMLISKLIFESSTEDPPTGPDQTRTRVTS